MSKYFFAILILSLSSIAAVGQVSSAAEPDEGGIPSMGSSSPSGSATAEMRIPRGVWVKLRLLDGLNTATHHKGDVVHLELVSDLAAGGVVVLPAGSIATAMITVSRRTRGKERGAIEFSDPELTVQGEKIRLVTYNPNEVMEEAPAIVLGIAIAAPAVAAVTVALLPIAAVVHVVRRHRKKPPEHDVGVDRGTTFTYYTRARTVLKKCPSAASTP
jgi:hypothetical protein